MSPDSNDSHDYKADRIRLEKMLDDSKARITNRNVLVSQDGRNFYFVLDVGMDEPAPVQLIYPSPVDDWDMAGARLARAWFYIEFARCFPGVVPVFGEVEDAA